MLEVIRAAMVLMQIGLVLFTFGFVILAWNRDGSATVASAGTIAVGSSVVAAAACCAFRARR